MWSPRMKLIVVVDDKFGLLSLSVPVTKDVVGPGAVSTLRRFSNLQRLRIGGLIGTVASKS